MAGQRKRWHQRMFRVHSWCGVALGLLLFVVCFSGTLAVVADEIDWLLVPGQRVAALAGEPDWPAVLATARATRAEAEPLFLSWSGGARSAVHLALRDRDGRLEKRYIDPADGSVTGRSSWLTAQRFLRDFHRRFFTFWGLYFVSALGVALLVSALTPLWFYRRWWRKWLRLRRDHGRRILWSDLHKLSGLWSLAFALIIGVTGSWYLVERVLFDVDPELIFTAAPRVAEARLATLPPNAPQAPPEALIRAAREAVPGLAIRNIRPATAPGEAFEVDGRSGAWLLRDRATQVHLDPYSGEVLRVRHAEALSTFDTWVEMADPLHFGDFGGIWSKLVWLVFGLLLSSLMLTGAWLQWMRLRSREAMARRRKRDPAPPRWGWHESLGLLAMLVVAGVSVAALAHYARTPDTLWHAPVALEAGPWRIAAQWVDGGDGATLVLRPLCDDCHALLRSVRVGEQSARLHGPALRLPLPEAEPVTAQLTGWDGRTHDLAIPPPRGAAAATASPHWVTLPVALVILLSLLPIAAAAVRWLRHMRLSLP